MRSLFSRFSSLQQQLNPDKRYQIAIRQRSTIALLQAFRQHIGERINRDSHGHRLIMGQFDSADRNFRFVLHARRHPVSAFGFRQNLSNRSKTQDIAWVADSPKMSPISNIPSVNLSNAQGSGLAAIATGNQKLSEDAQQIANPDNQNVTGALVDLNQALVLTEAGANVISTESKMLGSLLNAFA